MLCRISGYLYDPSGNVITEGQLTVRLQQDLVSIEGQKIVPITLARTLGHLAAPTGVRATGVGAVGTTTYYYYVQALDGSGGHSLLVATTGIITTSSLALDGTNYNIITWPAVPGAVSYLVYGRTVSNAVVLGGTTGTTYYDTGAVVGTGYTATDTTGTGFIDLSLMATVGASPGGIAYFAEFDPDPNDLTMSTRTKDGYWANYWSVPNTPSVSLGSFVSAERGAPFANYMPLGGSVPTFGDSLVIGSAATNTTKEVIANQIGSQPKLRFNPVTGVWEFSNNGIAFVAMSTVYLHTQGGAATTWTISHNKGAKGVGIVFTNQTDLVIAPSTVTYTNLNTVTVTFATPQAGFAYVR